MITERRRARPLVHPLLIIWLTAVWVLLWSDLTPANVLAGLAIAVVVTNVLPLEPVPFRARLHPVWAARALGRFVLDLFLASAQVARLALSPGRVPRGAVLRVRLRSQSDVVLVATAELVSLVPGSLVVEAHRLTGTLYVHVLDVSAAGGVQAACAHVLEQERRVLYAIATDAEIEEAGLPPRSAAREVR